MSAVSTKLMPASSARWMTRTESSWSGLPQAPNIIVPRQSFETWTPVRPSGRYSMGISFESRAVPARQSIADLLEVVRRRPAGQQIERLGGPAAGRGGEDGEPQAG